jgi:hypothetical protein
LKIELDKVPTGAEKNDDYDEEVAAQHSKVTLTFVFPDDKRVTHAFTTGDTTLAIKKALFDMLEVDYGKMTLWHNDDELIGTFYRVDLSLFSLCLCCFVFVGKFYRCRCYRNRVEPPHTIKLPIFISMSSMPIIIYNLIHNSILFIDCFYMFL